jgi:hypothetical protein
MVNAAYDRLEWARERETDCIKTCKRRLQYSVLLSGTSRFPEVKLRCFWHFCLTNWLHFYIIPSSIKKRVVSKYLNSFFLSPLFIRLLITLMYKVYLTWTIFNFMIHEMRAGVWRKNFESRFYWKGWEFLNVIGRF